MHNQPTKLKSTLSVAWLLSYISIASVSAAMITPALPSIAQAYALKTGAVEWIVSAFLVGYVFGQLLYGPLANSYGRLNALKWGLNINLFGLILCLFASYHGSYLLLLVGRLITGLGAAAGLTCTFMLISEWLPEAQQKSATANSIFSFALGIGVSVLLGGIITEYIEWQSCFIFLMLQGIVMRIGVRVFDETLIQAKPLQIGTLLQDYARALRSFQLVTFSSIWGVCSALGYCYAAAAPQLAHAYLHLSAAEYSYWNTLNIIGMLIGGFSARIFMQRISVTHLIILGYLGASFALLNFVGILVTNSQSALWFFISACLLSCFNPYLFAGGSYMASHAIEDKASASSMMSFINMGVGTVSVIVMGYVSSNPFHGFLWTMFGLFCITNALFICFHLTSKRL